jgi:hypothetical protein
VTPAENKRILEAVFAATAQGNGRPFLDALADDVRWSIIGTTAWSRTYEGKGAVVNELLRPLSAQLADANVIKAHRFIAEGDQVVVEGRGFNRTKAGKPYENAYCWIIRMADGKMAEITEFADTQLIANALSAPRIER